MISLPIMAAGASVAPVAIKAVGEMHRHIVLQSNTLARQGNGTPTLQGLEDTLERQRAAGIRGGLTNDKDPPAYMDKVPNRPITGDSRKEYVVGKGNATSSRGRMADILSKVPKRTVGGSADYKKSNKSTPKRAGGFGNQSFTP